MSFFAIGLALLTYAFVGFIIMLILKPTKDLGITVKLAKRHFEQKVHTGVENDAASDAPPIYWINRTPEQAEAARQAEEDFEHFSAFVGHWIIWPLSTFIVIWRRRNKTTTS